MAKKYIVKKYYKRRTKWSSNINKIINQTIEAPRQSEFYGSILLTQNPAQSETSVSQQYTVKNVEFAFDITVENSGSLTSIENLTVYIIYVPQGFTVDSNIINSHPEWIMAYRYLGGPDSDQLVVPNTVYNFRNPIKVKTRLARRLQTGDSIHWLVTGINEGTDTTAKVNGIVRWWTKAN